jgi:hypothetical protein
MEVQEGAMKRVVLAIFAVTALAAGPAMAQPYYEYILPNGERGSYGGYREDYRGPPRYRVVPEWRYGPYRGPDRYGPYGGYERRRPYRQTRVGSVCVTSRGSCGVGYETPVNTPCSCYIPGFGPKRGAVGY